MYYIRRWSIINLFLKSQSLQKTEVRELVTECSHENSHQSSGEDNDFSGNWGDKITNSMLKKYLKNEVKLLKNENVAISDIK